MNCYGCSGFGDVYLDGGDIVTCQFCYGSGVWGPFLVEKPSKTAKKALDDAAKVILDSLERIALNQSKPH